MNNDIRTAAIEQIIELLEAEEITADEFTVSMFAEQSGMNEKQARDRLTALVRSGDLESRLVLFEGRRRYAYRKPRK